MWGVIRKWRAGTVFPLKRNVTERKLLAVCGDLGVCGVNYEVKNRKEGKKFQDAEPVCGARSLSTLFGKSCLVGVDVKFSLGDHIFASYLSEFPLLELMLAFEVFLGG